MVAFVMTLGRRITRAALAFSLVLSALALSPPLAHAEQDALGPPPPLQWPTLGGPSSNRSLLIGFLRAEFEKGGNTELCKILMKEANIPIPPAPPEFDFSMCPAQIVAKVNARQGKVRWAEGAKPTQCGMSCWGRPSMTREQFLDRPNTHYALFYGNLKFEVDNPGPNRTVTFGYEAQFRCLIAPGARDGTIEIRAVFGQPVVGDPSFWEGVADFFLLPLNISRQIEAGIRRELSRPGTTTIPDQGRCTSIGVEALPQGNPNFDTIRFDLPPPRGPIHTPIAGTSILSRNATVHFLRITRKPPTFGYDSPAEPGTFHVFLNGLPGYFPETPALNLPPAGASAPLNLCKTIDMNRADRLQIIFVNSLGGAVWSQYAPNQGFGGGAPRTMTSGRTVMVPGLPGPPDPRTGRPGPVKPRPLLLREFEILYTIETTGGPPSAVIATPPASGGGHVRPGLTDARAPTAGVATTGDGGPQQPCRKI